MNKHFVILLCGAITGIMSSCSTGNDGFITDLKCEYLHNPLELAVKTPSFSWQLHSEGKDVMQEAYQITAWSDQDTLWDTRRIPSEQSVDIIYKGKPLTSGQHVSWNVKVWDNHGGQHTSATAFFETGLYSPADWQAEWIGKPYKKSATYRYRKEDINWIWYPEPNSDQDAPKGSYDFRKTFFIANPDDIIQTRFLLTADDKCVLYINGQQAGTGEYQKIKHLNVKNYLKKGENRIEIVVTNTMGGAGLLGQLYLEKADGAIQYVSTDDSWFVSKNKEKQVYAHIFGRLGHAPGFDWMNEKSLVPEEIQPPSYMRKTFDLKSPVRSARLYVTALGSYRIFLNGKLASDYYLAPGFTDYNKRVLYQAYDVISLLQKGGNAIGAILADGWYAGTIGWGHSRNNYGSYPLWLLAELHITGNDGHTEVIKTDGSWKSSFGPIQASDMLDGETYDARMEIPGWKTASFDDSQWENVVTKTIAENITGDPGPAVTFHEELSPKSVFEPKTGRYVYDLGQNMVGVVRLNVSGNKGDTVTLRFAEVLNPDSTIYTANLRTAKATDRYVLKGEGTETYTPEFTFHGFRYVELSGLKGNPGPGAVTGLVIGSATPRTGYFECSNELLNQIYHNALWGQKGNYLSVPTDCPQRDERLGWMGDALVFTQTAAYNMDVSCLF